MAKARYKKTLNDMDRLWIDHNQEMSIADLSKKLKTTADTVRDYKEQEVEAEAAPEHVTTTKDPGKKDHFARKGGAIVMTEAQSYTNNHSKQGKAEHLASCIHTFKSKDSD
jgi:hypothetical protein